jgi:uncharacterized membrane protein YGL010W
MSMGVRLRSGAAYTTWGPVDNRAASIIDARRCPMDMRALLEEYELNHQTPACKATHAVGIPLIVLSVPLLFFNRRRALSFFALGWVLQFAGHAMEGKRPKFFEGSEYLLAGLVWWLQLVSHQLSALGRQLRSAIQ